MISVQEVADRRRIHPSQVFERARIQWRNEANTVSDYCNYVQTGVIPPYVAAFLDCEERKLCGAL